MSKEPEFPPIRDPILERPLPSSPEAERAILGAIILDNSLIAQAVELLMPSDFYVPSHRRIFLAMIALFERGSEINPILIAEELKKDNSLDSSGGMLFITNLTFGVPHTSSLTQYAKVVRGKSLLRKLVKAASKITAQALEEEDEPEIVLEASHKAIFDITLDNTSKSFALIEEIAERSLHKTYEIQESGVALTGVSTGFADLDALTLGLQKSDLIIIAGRPSMGKSQLGIQIATNAALRENVCTALFSLEMPEEQIAMRVLCSEARINSQAYRSGYVNQHEWDKLGQVFHSLVGKRLHVDDAPILTVTQIKARAMRLASELSRLQLELGLIVVDYLQLITGSTNRRESLYQQVTQISKELKGVARELGMPMAVLCQLSRAPENRTDHRPVLADLRESGAIEQDADVVAFVYRGDMYKGPNEEKDNIAEIIVAKQRNGPTGNVFLRFNYESARFDSFQQQH